MRRSTVLILAAAALVLAACEIRTDYAMVIEDDTSATLAFEIAYDAEAAELFGPAESFLDEEIEGDVGSEIEGVTLLSTEADSSDPENQRVTANFAARDAEAFDRLVEDLFPDSSFTNDGGSTWVLVLRPDADVAEDFGDEFALDELGLDFLSGEVRIDHAGSQVAMTGGTSEGGNQVVWNPYGADSLEVVMDLSGATPPVADPGGEAEDSLEEPDAEEPGAEVEDAGEPGAGEPGAGEPDAGEPGAQELDAEVEDTEEPGAGEPAGEPDAVEPDAEVEGAEVAATAEDDDGGLSLPLLALIGGGLLLLVLLLVLVLRGRGKGADGPGQATGQPPAMGATAGSYQPSTPPGGAEPSQQPTQQLHPTPPSQQPTQQRNQPPPSQQRQAPAPPPPTPQPPSPRPTQGDRPQPPPPPPSPPPSPPPRGR